MGGSVGKFRRYLKNFPPTGSPIFMSCVEGKDGCEHPSYVTGTQMIQAGKSR